MPIIETANLSKTYIDSGVNTRAVRNINLKIEKGEFIAIMGPSGSGKSTLLHILGLLDVPSEGSYKVFDKDVTILTDEEQAILRNRKMGFIFQSFNLLPRMTVLENVILPLYYSGLSDKEWVGRARRAIEEVGLTERANYRASLLSGGEKQRVAIARALINQPDIIFADEPTGNLDSKSGGVVMEALQTLNIKHKHTVVLITHESYTAEHAERIIRIHDGEIASDTRVETRRFAEKHFEK